MEYRCDNCGHTWTVDTGSGGRRVCPECKVNLGFPFVEISLSETDVEQHFSMKELTDFGGYF